MASDTIPPGAQPPEAQSPQWTSPYEAAIEDRLQQTRRQVKVVDLGAGLLALGAATLAYLMVATLLDQWIVPGGLGFWGRLLMFVGLVIVTGYYFVRRLLPLLVYKINPLFAAQTIEQSRPSLKNSLINFLFLRQHRQELNRSVLDQRIYEGLEHTAAVELTHVPAETVVDRSHVIRLGYLLAAVLAIVCLYLVLSPKNPLVSFSRVILPWADIQAPSRVTITAIEPGDTVAFQGDTLTISAEVQGLQESETVTLYYTTADKQSVNQAIPMTVPDKGYRYQCDLPPDPAGLQQNVTYYLQAGDAKTRRFTVDVQTALAILVDRVEYDYPDYTGIADTSVKGTGDIRAIEGTKVTVHATANQEIDRAMLEMNCDPRNVLAMKEEGKQATGHFRLMMDPSDPLRPKYDSYQIRFRDRYGHENRRPIRHQIDVTRDQPPEIHFVDAPPEEVDIQLPVNGSMDFKVRAQDPDFGLRRVVLHAERDKRSLPIGPLLEKRSPEKAHQGPFEASYRFEPAKLGLKAGDKVDYWAEARDNKEEEPNRSETPRRRITIVEAEEQQPQQQAPKDGEQGKQPPPEGQQQPPDQPQQGQGQDAEGQQGEQPGEKQMPNEQPQEKPNDQNQQGQEDQQAGQQGKGDPSGKGSQQQAGDQKDQPSGKQSETGGEGQEGQGAEAGKEGQAKADGSQKGEQQPGQQSKQPNEPIDPDSNPGDAFEKILQHRKEQQSKQDQNAQSKPDQGEKSTSDQPKPGEQQSGEPKPDQPQPDQQGGDEKQGMKEGQKQPASDQKSGTEKPSSKSGEQAPQGAQQGKEQQGGSESPDQPKPEGQSQGQGGKEGQEKQPSEGSQPNEGQQTGKGDQQGKQQSGDQMPQPGEQKQPDDGTQPGTEKTAQRPSEQPNGEAQRVPDTGQQGTRKTGEGQKPEPGQGAQTQKPGESAQEKPGEGQEKPEAKGGDPQSAQGEGRNEKAKGEDAGAPSPQEGNQPRQQKSPDQTTSGQDQGDSGKSPSISKKQSDSKSDAAGDRSGGGDEGGGQKSEQSGTGGAGSHTESEQGANQGQQPGEGETGEKAGDQAKADRRTGSKSANDQGPGTGQRKQPGGQQPGDKSKETPQPGKGGESSSEPSGGQPEGTTPDGRGQQAGRSSPTGGQQSNQESPPPEPPETKPSRPDEVNRKYAEEAVNLSLETLEQQLAKDKPDPELLDRLGWSRDELERFYRQWSDMRRSAGRQGQAGEAAKQEWNKALQSLGLRQGSTEIRASKGAADQLRDLKESRRIPPPPGWAEQFRAYTESVAGGKQGE